MNEIETKLTRLDELLMEKFHIFQFFYPLMKPLLDHLGCEDFVNIGKGINGKVIIDYIEIEEKEGDEHDIRKFIVIDSTYFDNPKEYIEKHLTETVKSVY